ncbi:MAG: Zn-dependent hydrolase [Salinarimonadaceae bacterium]|nr:MAG: Zn-dependent hydrolase [Salinarimonadaceae bacterium]
MSNTAERAARVMEICARLSAFTDEPGRLTRLYLSPAHKAAAHETRAIMTGAGLDARIDAVGNVVGRLGPEGAPTLYLGSHIDTVVDAGRYDGTLGVACAIVAAGEIAATGRALPFALEVLAFGDEENVRFPTSLSTSKAAAGGYDAGYPDVRDDHGVTLAEALAAFGGDAAAIPALARDPAKSLGYLEIHIEQGPVLEARGAPLGVVTAINAAWRANCRVVGEAGHAGTAPMDMRRDALAGAARMIAAIEEIGRAHPDAVATVGRISADPGAVNVIAGQVAFTIDARAPREETLAAMIAEIEAACPRIAGERGLDFECTPYVRSPATPMDARLQAALAEGARRVGTQPLLLPSGAGHDAVAMSRLCPVGMIFVRCERGISHNPAENVLPEDAGLAAGALLEAIFALVDSAT